MICQFPFFSILYYHKYSSFGLISGKASFHSLFSFYKIYWIFSHISTYRWYWKSLKGPLKSTDSSIVCMSAKSLQLCLTLCDPMDCSLARLLCPWDFPGKNTIVYLPLKLTWEWNIQGLIWIFHLFSLDLKIFIHMAQNHFNIWVI